MTEEVQGARLPGFGVSLDDALEVVERERAAQVTRHRDRRICVCGHPMSKHYEGRGYTRCNPSRMTCDCENMIAVIEAEDVRCFLWATKGYGAEHALLKGITSLAEKGKSFEWLEDRRACMKCGNTERDVLPYPITSRWQASRRAERINALLCQECVSEIGVVG